MPGKLTEQPVAGVGTESDLYLVVQAVQSRKQTRTQLRAAIVSGWQAFIGTFLAATDLPSARSALGLAIGSNVQAFDSDLQALAGVSTAGLLSRTGAGTAAARTLTGTANKVTVTNGDGVSGNPTLTLPDALALVTPTVSGLLNCTGGQIAFPAAQNPSADPNTLDDYEEGTWTPTITFTTPGDLNVVYSIRQGFYTRVGRLVQWSALITTSTFTFSTGTGALLVSGLPFAAASNPPVSFARWVGITSSVSTPQVSAILNSTNVQFEVMNVASGTTASLTQANAPTGVQKQIYIGGTYNI